MASTSSSQLPQPAPWKASFHEHVTNMDSPEFVFSSLHTTAGSIEYGGPPMASPRARFCIYRGFWGELPENQDSQAPQNPRVYESDLPTFTTDVRMNKSMELFASSSGRADNPRLAQGSGGGGPCEAVWWAKHAMVQWRVRGKAFVVGPDIEDQESSGVRTVKSEIGRRMRVVSEEDKETWSWGKELTAHFGNLSPGRRGSFKAPPPGQPVDRPYDDQKLQLGGKVEDLHDATAREHFRVVIIRPQEVESIDLSDPQKSRRQRYTYDAATGSWTHQECWP